jgi:DNA-binding NtrC family response regulator
METNPMVRSMKILMLIDDGDRMSSYKRELIQKNHHNLVLTCTAEACLRLYHYELQEISFKTDPVEHVQPFDVVVLDCKSCNGIEIAKEILAVNPRQRIVLALTAEVYETVTKEFTDVVKTSLDLIQKPFTVQRLVDIVELKEVYSALHKMCIDTNLIRCANFRHEQIISILNIVTRSRQHT